MSGIVKCWICRFPLRTYEPVTQHQTTVRVQGERVAITPLAHVECVARVRRQVAMDGWAGPKDTGELA